MSGSIQNASLDATFAALADPTRRAILFRLMRGDASASQLAEPFRISLPGILKHLHVLENAGLVELRKQGRLRQCHLIAGPIREAADWLSVYRQFWERNLALLAGYLESPRKKTTRSKKHKRTGG